MTEVAAEDDDSQKSNADYNERVNNSLVGTKMEITRAAEAGADRALSWIGPKNAHIADAVVSQLEEEGYTVKVKKDEDKGSVSLWIDVPKPEDS